MFSSFSVFFTQFKLYFYIAIGVAFLGLFAHDRYLSHVIDKKEEQITSLNTTINNLKSSIEFQNQAIKNMNEDFEKQKSDFQSRYESVKKSNEAKKVIIAKKEQYTTPENVKTESDQVAQSRVIFKEWLKNRGVK